MPVTWQNIDLPMGAGMDQQGAKTALPPGQPVSLQNAYFGKRGAWQKRPGFDTQLGVTFLTPPELREYGARVVGQYAQQLMEYSPTSNKWLGRGTLRTPQAYSQVAKSSSSDIQGCDSFSVGGYTTLAWYDGTGINAEIRDESTGTVVASFTNITNTGSAYVQCIGVVHSGFVYFYVLDNRSVDGAWARITNATGSWVSLNSTFRSTGSDILRTRACIGPDGASFYIAGVATNASLRFRTKKNFDFTSAWGVSEALACTESAVAVCASKSGNFLYLARISNTPGTIQVDTFSALDGSLVTSAILADITPTRMTFAANADGSATLIYDDATTSVWTGGAVVKKSALSFGGTTLGAASVIFRGVSLASDAYYYGTDQKFYFAVEYYSLVSAGLPAALVAAGLASGTQSASTTINSAFFVVTLDGQWVSRSFRGSALLQPGCSSSSLASGGMLTIAARTLSLAETATIQSAVSLGGVGLVRLDLGHERFRATTGFKDLLIAGGRPQMYDGNQAAELGFSVYPEIVRSYTPAAAGSWTNLLPFNRSTPYTIGDMVPAGTSAPGYVLVCVVPGQTAGVQPSLSGTLIVDGSVTWQKVAADAPTTFQANGSPYAVAKTVLPTTTNGRIYAVQSLNAGSNGIPTAEPAWPTTIGSTVLQTTTDGHSITFVCLANWDLLTAQTSYTLAACYSWVDDQGLLHRSALSPPVTITLPTPTGQGIARNAALVFGTLRTTTKSNVRIEVYSTSGSGTVLQLVGIVANSTAVDAVAWVDTIPDTTQALGSVLYQGSLGAGGLANKPPPSCTAIATVGARAFCNNTESPYMVCPSQLVQDGYSVAWADELAFTLNAAKGQFVAPMAMDGVIYLFQETGISAISGDGPDNTGSGVPWGQPTEIASDVGCVDVDSLLLTPAGIMFRSAKGMYLLGRDRTLAYIGEPVQTELANGIVSAVVDPTTHQAVFIDGNDNILVYDWARNAWGQWLLAADVPQFLSTFQKKLVVVEDTGQVLQMSGSTFLDGGQTYGMAIELAPVRLAGVEGYARVRSCNLRFALSGSPSVTVSVKEDYADSAAYTLAAKPLTATQDHVQVSFRHQKMSAVSLVISESTPGSDLVLEGVQFEIGVKRGLSRVPTAKRSG